MLAVTRIVLRRFSKFPRQDLKIRKKFTFMHTSPLFLTKVHLKLMFFRGSFSARED